MSGNGDSEPDGAGRGGFLSRWSQRKRAGGEAPVPAASPEPEPPPEEAFDVSLLPSIDEITGESDVAVFLQKGVPEALKNAALRKVWTLDPILKDYIGPVDYGWDYNNPTGVPGFGPLAADLDLSAMSRQIFGEKTVDEGTVETAAPARDIPTEALPEPSPVETAEGTDATDSSRESVDVGAPEPVFPRRKRHGGAVPG